MNLLDAEYFHKWQAQHADALQQAVEKRKRAAQEVEAERSAKARSAIISGMMRWRREGYTAAEAARRLPFDSNNGCSWGYSYTDLINMLPELGVSRREYFDASKGGAA
jgi:uncharacterized membrane protein YcjF (UPF0283 family)